MWSNVRSANHLAKKKYQLFLVEKSTLSEAKLRYAYENIQSKYT